MELKINLNQIESIKYKINDEISIELSIDNDVLTLNTINKAKCSQKNTLKNRFNTLCYYNPNTDTPNKKETQEFRDQLFDKIKDNFKVSDKLSDSSDNSNKIEKSSTKIQQIETKLMNNLKDYRDTFKEVSEIANDYAQKNKEKYGVCLEKIGTIDKRVDSFKNPDFRAKMIEIEEDRKKNNIKN